MIRKLWVIAAVVGACALGAAPTANAQINPLPPISGGALIYPDYAGGYNPPYWIGGYGAQPILPSAPYGYGGSYGYGNTAYVPGELYGPNGEYYRGANMPAAPRRQSDSVEVTTGKGGTFTIEWRGDPRTVATMSMSALDAHRKTLQTHKLTGLPARATFANSPKAAYYRVAIKFMDGTSSTITGPV